MTIIDRPRNHKRKLVAKIIQGIYGRDGLLGVPEKTCLLTVNACLKKNGKATVSLATLRRAMRLPSENCDVAGDGLPEGTEPSPPPSGHATSIGDAKPPARAPSMEA